MELADFKAPILSAKIRNFTTGHKKFWKEFPHKISTSLGKRA